MADQAHHDDKKHRGDDVMECWEEIPSLLTDLIDGGLGLFLLLIHQLLRHFLIHPLKKMRQYTRKC